MNEWINESMKINIYFPSFSNSQAVCTCKKCSPIPFPLWQTLILCQYLWRRQMRKVWAFALGKDAAGYEVIALQSAGCFRQGGKDNDTRRMSWSSCGMRSGLRGEFSKLPPSSQQEKQCLLPNTAVLFKNVPGFLCLWVKQIYIIYFIFAQVLV